MFKPAGYVGEWRGLNTETIRRGALNADEYEVLKAVLADLQQNTAYGHIYIAQVPRAATLTYVETRMNRIQTQWKASGQEGIGLSVVDYLGLLKPDRRRTSEREEMNEILKDAKTFAVGFDNGNGVPLLSPWQMSREAHNNAQTTGHYTLGSLSDTSESEKSPDTIVSLFREPGSVDSLTWQFLKMRDGKIPGPITVKTDFTNAYFTSPNALNVTSVSGGSATVSLGASFDVGAFGI
jgi:replicative DNA helicase